MPPHATIAILSIGSMGLGIASLLQAQNYHVLSNVSDRSVATRSRAESAGIECVTTDDELVRRADYILSIVPPRDAVATAKRVQDAVLREEEHQRQSRSPDPTDQKSLYFLDLNAISPKTAKTIHASFASRTPSIRFIDGGIIGGPPTLLTPSPSADQQVWKKPGVPLSGHHTLPPHLHDVLNARHLDTTIGSASGLKCCFAALSKGFTALALQSFTTARRLGVYDPLQRYLDEYNPAGAQKARAGVVGCTGKAYRWVEEMRMIGECFGDGGWGSGGEEDGGGGKNSGKGTAEVFREIAGVFQTLADVVEREGTGGMGDVEGVTEVLGRGLR